ncbi:leiomodin-1 isoform X2 [Megalops cyprinoides]|uniref:leiomodin-1 isoform X2 n=1 Tax=Megalops cyprinoides TaxID=118141 RepID=UPI001863F9F8|nr:leiomodin-1 isoform X2 [Megalops cyprinoides]
MSRRKVRGLTRTGRQVSEDPDIDNLLSTLSPEEMEELEKEVMTVPDSDPNEIFEAGQRNRLVKQPSVSNNREAKLDPCERDTKRLPQRELSFEGEPRKESRKQEYLRKMGLSQEKCFSSSESQDGGLQRQDSVSTEGERKMEERNCKEREDPKGNQVSPSERFRRMETQDKVTPEEGKGKERYEESKKKEESNSKTRDLISKLQEKKEDTKEKERKEETRRRDEGKTKELISKLQEKKEESKERERKEEIKRRDDSKTRGLISKLEEKQSQGKEVKADIKKDRGEEKGNTEFQLERSVSHEKEKEVKEDMRKKEKGEKEEVKETEKEKEKKEKENTKEKEKEVKGKENREKEKEKENYTGKEKTQKSIRNEEPGNCKSPVSKTKEEEEEDEAASMFDEPLEKVRSNDPSMTELNVNNSEVIKTKTLIQFAEALKDNTHVKTFSLANTRADDHVAYAIAGTLRSNKTITSINLDSNHLTNKGIISLIQALQHNATLTELRFHNQRHICGGKTEMEMVKVLKENTTLLKLGYHFELAGPRMTMTNILSRNMDRQRQRRLQEQKQAQANGEKKGGSLEVPKAGGAFLKGSPKASPQPSPQPSPLPSPLASPRVTPKRGGGGGGAPPPPAPPPPPPAPLLEGDFLRNSLSPASQRKLDDRGAGRGGGKNSRDQLLASIRASNIKQLKKVTVPKLLQ